MKTFSGSKVNVIFLLAVLSFCLATPAFAGLFRGRVVGVDGTPVSFAALYLREIQTGISADENGHFQLRLAPGSYTCEVSSIGFAGQQFTFVMNHDDVEKIFVLEEQIYALREVNIVKGKEDPAYGIMRRAIARAPFHRTQVKKYTAGTYLKGTGRMRHIPSVLKLSKEVRKFSKEAQDRLFVLEEQRKVTFEAPDKWDIRVLAYRNSFPDNISLDFGPTSLNPYTPMIFGKVSPLGQGSFSYYNFRLEGCYTEGDRLVNKVRVIPKKDNPRLLDGHLYIIEDLWCLSGADLTFRSAGMKATIKLTCKEVQPSVFMSTSTHIICDFDVFGVKADASFLSAVHYADVKVGSWKPAEKNDKPLTEKQRKLRERIETLLGKDELSVSDAYKLARMMEKNIEEQDSIRPKHKYERPQYGGHTKKETDSLAGKKDSLYWEAIRSVPLHKEEAESFVRKEKLQTAGDTTDNVQGRSGSKGILINALLGRQTFRTRNGKAWLTLGGLTTYVPQYNFVDGFWIGTEVKTGIRLSESSSLHFIPSAYYATARHTWLTQGLLSLDYAPRRRGQLSFSAGLTSSDYNEHSTEWALINSLAAACFGRNDVKLFQKQFFTAEHRIEPANGLLFSASLSWQRRKSLDNRIAQSWFKKTAQPNIPQSPAFVAMPDNERLKIGLELEYTPAHYYRMRGGKKVYEPSRYPTFGIKYENALATTGSLPSPSYRMAEISARQKLTFGLFNELFWAVDAGMFWDRRQMQFPDFRHFNATRIAVTARTFDRNFSLADNYRYSTNDRWCSAYLSWHTPYLLVKHLPWFKNKLFDEALHLRTLTTYGNRPYTEAGYSIGFAQTGRLGVFAGFEGGKYRSAGISVSIPLFVSTAF